MMTYANRKPTDNSNEVDRSEDGSPEGSDDPPPSFGTDSLSDLVWIVDADNRFRFVNQRWTEYTGRALDESDRSGWEALLAPEDIATFEAIGRAAWQSGNSGEIMARLRSASGQHRWFLIRAVPLPPDLCGEGCWLGTATDIHERQQTEDTQLFIADLDSRMRAASTPEDMLTEVVQMLGARLQVRRCGFLQIDLDTDISHLFKVYEHVERGSFPASFDRSVLPRELLSMLTRGDSVVIDDIYSDPRIGNCAPALAAIGVRAFIAVPILRQGVHAGTLAVAEVDHARIWQPNEIALVQAVAERTWLAMESTGHFRKSEEAERMRRQFARDVMFIATNGRLRVCDTPDDLPTPLTQVGPEIDLWETVSVSAVRRAASEAAMRLGFEEARRGDLVLAVGEAAINVVVHGGGGMAHVYDDHRETIQLWFIDHGDGIHFDSLPHATMARGFSTASTLGQGFKMILETADRVYLLTGTTGTTVVVEHDRVPAEKFGVLF